MSIIWRQFAKRHKKIEDEFIPKMDKVVSNEIQKAADYFRKNGNLSMRLDSIAMYEVLKELYKKSAFSEATIYYNKLKGKKYLGLGQNEAWNKVVETYLLQHNVFNTVERINETTKKELLKIISDGIQRGDSIDMIVKTISENDIPLKRARLIVRTESVGAMNLGGMMGAISTGIIYQKKWVTAQDHRVRGTKKTDQFSHVVLNDTLIDMDKAFNNGENIKFPGDKTGTSAGNFCNCFLPDELTSVNIKNVKKVFRSVYNGKVITIKASNGKSFTCTPNHPILTTKGWVEAGMLDKGSYLVNSSFINDSVFPEFNVKNSPSTFHKIYSSLNKVGVVTNIPGTVMDFYGDGSTGDVNIVEMNSLLTNRVKIRKGIKNRFFKKSNFRQVFLSSKRSFDMSLRMLFDRVSSHSLIGVTNIQSSLQGVGLSHSDNHTFTPISLSDTKPFESNNNSRPVASVMLGKGFDATSGKIHGFHFVDGDNCSLVLECSHKDYSGFVYTFETIHQIYDINSFVAKNCRCCMSYVAKRDANGRIMRYPDPSSQSGNKPGMSVGADGKLSDLMFQIIIGQILGNLIGQIFDNSAKEN